MKKIKQLITISLVVILMITVMPLFCACTPPNNNTKLITDMGGDRVYIPTIINRIGCTSNPCTNMLIALGVGDKLIGAYKTIFNNPWFDIFYPGSSDLTKYDSYQPESEALIASNIDLFITPTKERAEALREKGICAICIQFYTPDEIKTAVNLLIEIFDNEIFTTKGTSWLNFFEESKNDVIAKTANINLSERPTTYEIIGDKYRGLFRTSYGSMSAWMEYAGGVIATKDFEDSYSTGATPTEESILATNPDVIFIGGTYSSKLKDDLNKDVKWSNISAVKNNKIFILPVACCYWNDQSVDYPLLNYYAFSCMYPTKVDFSLNTMVHDFYFTYYNIDFSDTQISYMLNGLGPNGENTCD